MLAMLFQNYIEKKLMDGRLYKVLADSGYSIIYTYFEYFYLEERMQVFEYIDNHTCFCYVLMMSWECQNSESQRFESKKFLKHFDSP